MTHLQRIAAWRCPYNGDVGMGRQDCPCMPRHHRKDYLLVPDDGRLNRDTIAQVLHDLECECGETDDWHLEQADAVLRLFEEGTA